MDQTKMREMLAEACHYGSIVRTGRKIEIDGRTFVICMKPAANQDGSFTPLLAQFEGPPLQYMSKEAKRVAPDAIGRQGGYMRISRCGHFVTYGFDAELEVDKPGHGGLWTSNPQAVYELTGLQVGEIVLVTPEKPYFAHANLTLEKWTEVVETAGYFLVPYFGQQHTYVARPRKDLDVVPADVVSSKDSEDLQHAQDEDMRAWGAILKSEPFTALTLRLRNAQEASPEVIRGNSILQMVLDMKAEFLQGGHPGFDN